MCKTCTARASAIIFLRLFATCCTIFLLLLVSAAAWGASIVAWGKNCYDECNVPSPNGSFIAIAGDNGYSLGAKSDGSIVSWGYNSSGLGSVPAPNSGFTAVAAGGYHGLGLKSDGSIIAWGDNMYGQRNVPSPNSGFIAVSAGTFHNLGLKTDGSIVAWGNNQYGQCDVPSPNIVFTAVAGGWHHSVGLKSDGSIAAWGANDRGQCNVPTPNSGFAAVAARDNHSVGLKTDGSIVEWGDDTERYGIPSPNSGFTAIAAGRWTDMALRSDGSVAVWKNNQYGEVVLPSPNSGFFAIAAGDLQFLALSGPSVKIDKAAGQGDPTRETPVIDFTVVFGEEVTDFQTGDVSLSGTAGATTAIVTGSGATYNVAVSGMTTGGTVVASIGSGVAHDALGHGNRPSTSTDNSVIYYDANSLSVTINQALSQADYSPSSPLNFTVVFSEPVADFTTGDVTVTGTAGGTKTGIVTGSGAVYNVAVSGMTTGGTVVASIGANAAHASDKASFASTSTDNTVIWLGSGGALAPGTDKASCAPREPLGFVLTNVSSVPFTWGNLCQRTWNCFVLDASLNLIFGGSSCTAEYSPVTIQPGESTVVDMGGPATPGLYYLATYNPPQQLAPFVVDSAPLTATITKAEAQADPTNASPINFTVVFSEQVTDFVTGDVKLSGTAGATTAVVTGSGTTYNVAVSGTTGSGTVVASIVGGVAHDTSGMPNVPSTSTDNSVNYWPAGPPEAKKSSDGAAINTHGAIVSAAFTGFFYIESDDRKAGMRVDKAGHALTEGMRADISGTLGTNGAGERFIQASTAVQSAPPHSTGHVDPLVLSNKAFGGMDFEYAAGPVWPQTTCGQKGITGGIGLNNIGLLVTLVGRVVEIDGAVPAAWIRIEDGSGAGAKVALPTGTAAPAPGSFVRATGISSCEKAGDTILPLLRTRAPGGLPDFAVLAGP